MSENAQEDSSRKQAPHFSICIGWCMWLACLTLAVVIRQFWSPSHDSGTESPTVTAKFVVDLNTAEFNELQALPEVGPALATRIIDFRQSHGPFTTVENILEVPGVGPRTLEQLRPMLVVAPAAETVGGSSAGQLPEPSLAAQTTQQPDQQRPSPDPTEKSDQP